MQQRRSTQGSGSNPSREILASIHLGIGELIGAARGLQATMHWQTSSLMRHQDRLFADLRRELLQAPQRPSLRSSILRGMPWKQIIALVLTFSGGLLGIFTPDQVVDAAMAIVRRGLGLPG